MTQVHEVTLYTRKGCGLCDEAAVELRRLRAKLGFDLIEFDIDDHPDVEESYNDIIPVVIADGREIARAPFAAETLAELLT
jgi:hypothetical protein